jgi:hypothetical protein
VGLKGIITSPESFQGGVLQTLNMKIRWELKVELAMDCVRFSADAQHENQVRIEGWAGYELCKVFCDYV